MDYVENIGFLKGVAFYELGAILLLDIYFKYSHGGTIPNRFCEVIKSGKRLD
jgi:hypothetical protein